MRPLLYTRFHGSPRLLPGPSSKYSKGETESLFLITKTGVSVCCLLPAPAGAGAGATCLPIVLPPDQTTSSVGTLPRLSANNIESIRPARPGTERRLQSAAEHLKVHRAQVVSSWRDSCRLPLLPPCCPPSAPSSIHMGCHVVGPSPRRNHPAPASPCLARGYFAMLPAALPPLP